jgi:hypothetical protein
MDEPEQHVSNEYICETFCSRIRELKNRRQIILVTHSANIVVNGDADRVIAMSMTNPLQAAAPRVGTIDELTDVILRVCEGGKDAFEARKKRYKL